MALISLKGITPWLDGLLDILGRYGVILHRSDCVPGSGGNITVLLPRDVAATVTSAAGAAGPEIGMDGLQDLGRESTQTGHYYRPDASVGPILFSADLRVLHGRALLATVSGGKLSDLGRGDGKHLGVVAFSPDGRRARMIFGNVEHGTAPSTEFASHVLAHAQNLAAGFSDSAVVHVHPPALIDLSRHREAGASFAAFNRLLYTQRPELVANLPDLVGLIPYKAPGSGALLEASSQAIARHRAVVWRAHGVLIREKSVERCVDILEYVEASAAAALRSLQLLGALEPLSFDDVRHLVELYHLPKDILDLLS